jgi:hypothetical protein
MILYNLFNEKLLQGVQMLHGTVFSKRVPLVGHLKMKPCLWYI